MTDLGAASRFQGRSGRLARNSRPRWPALIGGSALVLGSLAGLVGAMGGMPEILSFFVESHELAAAMPQVAAIEERRMLLPVVTPPVGVPTVERLRHREAASAAPKTSRHPAALASIALPPHLFGSDLGGTALGFEKHEAVTQSAMNGFTSPEMSPDETQLAAVDPVRNPPVPVPAPTDISESDVRTVAALRVIEPHPQVVESARDALEAALVPMPSARPADAPPIFNRERTRQRAMPAPAALAYARPDAGAEDEAPAIGRGLFGSARPGNGVAVYDIAAATVYMPNGEKLEAHSGLGAMRDDARYVHQKMRGPTPPHVYDLTLRESLFHGVQAIRLHPVGGERRIYNRVGLLAHTYMLGKRGDSNGCVSFKDYNRFLAAFRRGEVKRLVVVARRSDPISRLGALFARR